MATWAWLYSKLDTSNNSPVTIDDKTVYWVFDIRNSDTQPTDDLTAFAPAFGGDQKGWVQCRGDIDVSWYCLDDVFMSHLRLQEYKYNENSNLPSNPIIESFHVFNMISPNHAIHCTIKLDLENYTIDQIANILLSYFKGGIDIGVTSGAGEADGTPRLFRTIENIIYTDFSSGGYLLSELKSSGAIARHATNRLWAVTSNDPSVVHPQARIPDSHKFPLKDNTKLLKELGLNRTFPLVVRWGLDSAPKWGFDWADFSFETVADLITDVVDAAVN